MQVVPLPECPTLKVVYKSRHSAENLLKIETLIEAVDR